MANETDKAARTREAFPLVVGSVHQRVVYQPEVFRNRLWPMPERSAAASGGLHPTRRIAQNRLNCLGRRPFDGRTSVSVRVVHVGRRALAKHLRFQLVAQTQLVLARDGLAIRPLVDGTGRDLQRPGQVRADSAVGGDCLLFRDSTRHC